MNKLRIPGVSDQEMATVNRLLDLLDAKTTRNQLRTSYYDMRRMAYFVGTSIPERYRQIALVLGWAAKAVDTLARRCRLEGFVWPEGDLGSLGMDDIWRDNLLDSEVKQGEISSLIHSVSFMVVTGGGPGEPGTLVHFKDATNAAGEWDYRLRQLSNLLSITSRNPEGVPTGMTLYLDGVTLIMNRDGKNWDIDRIEHRWGMPAEPLPYQPRLGRPFGSSRISRAVMSLQDQATRSAIRLEAHSDIYAIPDVWLLGADEGIFTDEVGAPTGALETVMGRVRGIPDDDEAPSDSLARADIKQFGATSPSPHLAALKQQAQLFSGETSIPLSSLGVSDMANPISANSYIASREDLIAEAEGATDDWSPYLRRVMVKALAVANRVPWAEVPDEWWSISPKWRSPIYLSRAQQADAGLKQLTAVPGLADTEVGLELVGLTPQQIERVNSERRRSNGAQTLMQMLGDRAAIGSDDGEQS